MPAGDDKSKNARVSVGGGSAQGQLVEPSAEIVGAAPHDRREQPEVVLANSEHLAVEVLALELDGRGVARDHGGVFVVELVETDEIDREPLTAGAGRLGEIDLDVVTAPGQELVGGHPVQLGEAEQAGDGKRTLAPLVCAQHGGLELLIGLGLHVMER